MDVLFVILVLFVSGWFMGQMYPLRRLRRLAGRRAKDGGIDYLLYNLDYTVKTPGDGKRTEVKFSSYFHGVGGMWDSDEHMHVDVTVPGPGAIADELHRIHSTGAMIVSLRPVEARMAPRNNRTDQQPPVLKESQMAIETNTALSVLDGKVWFDTETTDVDAAVRRFAEHKQWEAGTWRVRDGSTPEEPHCTVAKRRYRLSQVYGRAEALRTEIAASPVAFILRTEP